MSNPDRFGELAQQLGRVVEDHLATAVQEPVAYVLVIRPLSGPGSLASNMPVGNAAETMQASLVALQLHGSTLGSAH